MGVERGRRLPGSLLVLAASLGCGHMPTAPAPLGFGPVASFPDHRTVEVGFASADGAVMSGTLFLPRDPGRYAALVTHFGSNRWTREPFAGLVQFWTDRGIAVLSYDKRGVGRSQGNCCPWQDPGYFPLLGSDVLAGVRIAAQYPEVDPPQVGAFGFSQGGWVVPVTAATGGDDVAFLIIGSGPTVTLGEELLYSRLTGDAQCTPSGLSPEEIERQMDAAGPSRFDPRPYLEAVRIPVLWVYGALDTSIPVTRSVRIIDELRTTGGHDFTSAVMPRANHSWILDGAMCQETGPPANAGLIVEPWLAAHVSVR